MDNIPVVNTFDNFSGDGDIEYTAQGALELGQLAADQYEKYAPSADEVANAAQNVSLALSNASERLQTGVDKFVEFVDKQADEFYKQVDEFYKQVDEFYKQVDELYKEVDEFCKSINEEIKKDEKSIEDNVEKNSFKLQDFDLLAATKSLAGTLYDKTIGSLNEAQTQHRNIILVGAVTSALAPFFLPMQAVVAVFGAQYVLYKIAEKYYKAN